MQRLVPAMTERGPAPAGLTRFVSRSARDWAKRFAELNRIERNLVAQSFRCIIRSCADRAALQGHSVSMELSPNAGRFGAML